MKHFLIEEETPIIHWPDINIKSKRVLDLGCGRWTASTFEGTTPYYFLNQGAEFVVGIDACDKEIQFYSDLNLPNTLFKVLKLEDKNTFLELINHHNINVIKSDIEGNESLFLDLKKDEMVNIESFYIEYHGDHMRDLLVAKLPELGFNITRVGKMWIDGFGVVFAEKNSS